MRNALRPRQLIAAAVSVGSRRVQLPPFAIGILTVQVDGNVLRRLTQIGIQHVC